MPSTIEPARLGITARIGERPPLLAAVYLLLAVVLAVLGWNGLWDLFSLLPEQTSAWWTLATAVPACCTVLLKQRAPRIGLVASAVIFVVDLLTLGGLVPLLVLLEMVHAYTMAQAAERRRRVLVQAIVGTAAVAAAAMVFTADMCTAIMIGLQLGSLLAVTYWYANSLAQSRELVEMHRRRAEDAARIAELDRVAAVEGERDRMARELHDVVAGHISAIAIRSEAALGLPGDEAADRQALRAVRDASLEAHATLRAMIRVLRTGAEEVDLSPGRRRVRELVDAASASGVRATLTDEISGELPEPADRAVGRVVQEALANAVRHASGADVAVRLSEPDGELRVEVVSRGGSALASPGLTGSGMGLLMLDERIAALGGRLVAGPDTGGDDTDGDGAWVVRACLPRERAL